MNPYGSSARFVRLAVGLGVACAAMGCAETVVNVDRDRLISSRTERKPAGDWVIAAQLNATRDASGAVTGVTISATRDRPCTVTEIKTVDRTILHQREMTNPRLSRAIGYTAGSIGAASAVTLIAAATRTQNKADQEGLAVGAGVSAYLSIGLITILVREILAIDTETHVGRIDLAEARRDRCDRGAATGLPVRLLRTKNEAIAEGVLGPAGTATLPVLAEKLAGDTICGVEIGGVLVGHIEIPATNRASSVPSPAIATPP